MEISTALNTLKNLNRSVTIDDSPENKEAVIALVWALHEICEHDEESLKSGKEYYNTLKAHKAYIHHSLLLLVLSSKDHSAKKRESALEVATEAYLAFDWAEQTYGQIAC